MHPWPGFHSWLNATEVEIRDRYAMSGRRPDRLVLGASVRSQIEGDPQFWATAHVVMKPVPLCSHLRRPASCILCYMDSPEGQAARPATGHGAADPMLSDTSICRRDSWSDPASTPIDDIQRAMQRMMAWPYPTYPPERPVRYVGFRELFNGPLPSDDDVDRPTPTLASDWLDRMLATPPPRGPETARRCVCGHPLCDGKRHE